MSTLIDAAMDQRSVTGQRWDAALRRVYRKARSHTARIVIGLAAAYLVVFQTNLIWWGAQPLKGSAQPVKADAIVVLAGGVGESGAAGGGHQERLKQAVDLYKAGYANVMVLSSGFVYSFKEAEVMRALAIDQGVPAGQIELELRATNTYENVTFVHQILARKQWRSILLVSSPYHMRRAQMVWHKVAPEIRVTPTPPLQAQFYEHARGANFEQVRGILQEYAAIVVYWWRGWL